MKFALSFILVSGLAAVAVTAYAATARFRPFDPPTSDQLGLTGQDASRWNELRSRTLSLHESGRDAARQMVDSISRLLATDDPDLGAFDREAEQRVDHYVGEARALNAEKLAFYDHLQPSQRAVLRTVMRERLDRVRRLPFFAEANIGATP